MKPIFKTMVLLVALTLSIPNPAFALRAQELTEDSKRTAGLEEALRTSPDATLHEIGRIARSVLPAIPVVPAAGLEEGVLTARVKQLIRKEWSDYLRVPSPLVFGLDSTPENGLIQGAERKWWVHFHTLVSFGGVQARPGFVARILLEDGRISGVGEILIESAKAPLFVSMDESVFSSETLEVIRGQVQDYLMNMKHKLEAGITKFEQSPERFASYFLPPEILGKSVVPRDENLYYLFHPKLSDKRGQRTEIYKYKRDGSVMSEIVTFQRMDFPPAAGLEEKAGRNSLYYDPQEVAGRLLDALIRSESLAGEKFFDPSTGRISLNPAEAEQLLGQRPTADGFRGAHKNGRRLFQLVNRAMARAQHLSSPLFLRWQEAFRKGITGIEIALSREVDLRPWTAKRFARVVKRAQKEGLSFKPHLVEHGPQSLTPLGKELKRAYGQIVRTKKFPEYENSWPNFFQAHGVPLEEAYGKSQPARYKGTFSVYVDLERDERGLPIPDQRKHIADLKIARLDSLWKDPRVQQAKMVFLLNVRTWLSKDRAVLFMRSGTGRPHSTNISPQTFDPDKPVRLAVEIAVADPHHAVQVARRMDTGKIVYPFEGQVLFYLDPSVKEGRIQEGAFLFRALAQVYSSFWFEVAKRNPGTVYATRVRTFRRNDGRPNQAYFSIRPGVIRSTTLTIPKKRKGPLLTVQVDPSTGMPLRAWKATGGEPVFPRSDIRPDALFRVFVDPPRDDKGLVLPGTKPDLEITNPVWDRVWSKVSRSGAQVISIQGFPTYDPEDKLGLLGFFFEREVFLTSISSSESVLLQVDFQAEDPDRRPQVVRRMDATGPIVYPHPAQKRIWIDPVLQRGKVISGKLYKATHKLAARTVRDALKKSKRSVAFENLSTAASHGQASFWDPISNKRRQTALPYKPGIFVTAVAYRVKRRWVIRTVYDAGGQDVSASSRRETIQRDLAVLRHQKADTFERVEAAERLSQMGALNGRSWITSDLLRDLLFDYHGEVFRDVGGEAFFRLSQSAYRMYRSDPPRFWETVYIPLRQAEEMPPQEAIKHLGAASRALSAGMEERQRTLATAQEFVDSFESVSPPDSRPVVVIGRELAQEFLGLQVYAGLEERLVIDRGDPYDTLTQAAQRGDAVYFYGGLEEGQRLETLAGRAGMGLSFVLHNPADYSTDRFLLWQILKDLRIRSEVILAGLEEFTRALRELGEAA